MRLADGATVVGHKVGLTATAMQRLLRRGRLLHVEARFGGLGVVSVTFV